MDKSQKREFFDFNKIDRLFSKDKFSHNKDVKELINNEIISDSTILIVILEVLTACLLIMKSLYFLIISYHSLLLYISISEITIFFTFNFIWCLNNKSCKKKISKQTFIIFDLCLVYISILIITFIVLVVNDIIVTFNDLMFLIYPLILIGSSLVLFYRSWNIILSAVTMSIDFLVIIYFSIKFSQYSNTISLILLSFLSTLISFIFQRKEKNLIINHIFSQQVIFKMFTLFNTTMTSLHCSSFIFKNRDLILTTKKANKLLSNSEKFKEGNTITSQKIFCDSQISWIKQSEEINLKINNSHIIARPIPKELFTYHPVSKNSNVKKLFKTIVPLKDLEKNPTYYRNIEFLLNCRNREDIPVTQNNVQDNIKISCPKTDTEDNNMPEPILKNLNLYKILKQISNKNENHDKHCKCYVLTSKFLNIGNFHMKTTNLESYHFEILVKTEIYNDDIILNVILNDISEKQKMENMFKEMKKNFLKIEDSKGMFKKQVHEFKTPLISIIGSCEQLQREIFQKLDYKENIHFLINQIINISHYIKFLIKDMLAKELNCLDFKLVYKKTKLSNILDFCTNILISLLNCDERKSKLIKAKLFINSRDLNLYINIDEVRLKQILLNFISNSVKFTNSGEISIKANISKKNSSMLKISVKDTGCGIKKELLDHLYKGQSTEQFHMDEENNQFGTGLGLAIANILAKKMNIELKIKSVENFGTKFTLCIPNMHSENKFNTKFYYYECVNQASINSGKSIINNKIIMLPSRSNTEKHLNIYNNSILYDFSKRRRSLSGKESIKIDINTNSDGINLSIDDSKDTKLNSQLKKIEYSLIPIKFDEEIFRDNSSKNISQTEDVVRIHNHHFTFKNDNNDFSPINNIKNNININFTSNEFIQTSNSNLTSLKEKILVIDDQLIPRNSLVNNIKHFLHKYEDKYEILEGSDGIDCLKYLMDYHKLVKCVFIDENMTYMNGTETAKLIRSFNKLGIDPILILNSADQFELDQKIFNMVIIKPIEKDDLKNVLETYFII